MFVDLPKKKDLEFNTYPCLMTLLKEMNMITLVLADRTTKRN